MRPPRPLPDNDEIPVGETLTDQDQGATPGPREFAAPHLFLALECSRPEAGGSRHSLANVDRIRIGRNRVRRAERIIEGAARTLAIGVPDPRMSSEHAVIVRAEGCFTVADLGSRNGTRVNGTTVTRPIGLTDGELLELGHTLFRFRSEIRS